MTNTELTLDQLQTINGGRVITGTAGPGGSSFLTAKVGSTSGPGGTTFMTGQFDMPNGSARHRLTVDVWY